jgi:hypothetical protein
MTALQAVGEGGGSKCLRGEGDQVPDDDIANANELIEGEGEESEDLMGEVQEGRGAE